MAEGIQTRRGAKLTPAHTPSIFSVTAQAWSRCPVPALGGSPELARHRRPRVAEAAEAALLDTGLRVSELCDPTSKNVLWRKHQLRFKGKSSPNLARIGHAQTLGGIGASIAVSQSSSLATSSPYKVSGRLFGSPAHKTSVRLPHRAYLMTVIRATRGRAWSFAGPRRSGDRRGLS